MTLADPNPNRTRLFLLINGIVMLAIGIVLLFLEVARVAAYLALVGGVVLLVLGLMRRASRPVSEPHSSAD